MPQQEENERSSRRTLNLPSSGEPQPSTSGTQPPESPPLTIKCSPKKKTRPVPTVAQQKAYGACIMEMINKRLKNSNDGEMTAQENVTGESGEGKLKFIDFFLNFRCVNVVLSLSLNFSLYISWLL